MNSIYISVASVALIAIGSLFGGCTKNTPPPATTISAKPATGQILGNGKILLWNHQTAGPVTAITVSPDGAYVAAAQAVADKEQTNIRVWKTDSTASVWDLELTKPVYAMAFSANGKELVIGGVIKTALWDIKARKVSRYYGDVSDDPIKAVLLPPGGRELVTGGQENWLTVRDLQSGKMKRVFKQSDFSDSLSLSPDTTLLASSGMRRKVQIWDYNRRTLIRTLGEASYSEAPAVAFSPNGKEIAATSAEGVIHVWETKDWKLKKILRGHKGEVTSLSFSPDGTRLATAGEDGSIKIWQISTGKQLQALLVHKGPVNAVAYIKSNKLLLSGGEDGKVILSEYN
jgi:WD40 repeat protein